MIHHSFHRQRGVMLLTLVILMVVLFGVTSSILLVSVSESRALTDLKQSRTAFHLAEAGLESAKFEISESTDPDGDGVGNKTVSTGTGTYTVTSTDLGGGSYQLSSRGSSGERGVTLQSVVGTQSASAFPPAAISIIGDTEKEKIKLRKPKKLIIDGGDAPAIAVTDVSLFNKFYNVLQNAIKNGDIDESDITGTLSQGNGNGNPGSGSSGQGNGGQNGELPIENVADYPDELGDMTNLYDGVLNTVQNTIIPAAKKVQSKDLKTGQTYTYGTPTAPATVYLSGSHDLDKNTRINGYGTLVVSENFKLGNGGRLSWNGDVIVMGDSKSGKTAKVEVGKDGRFDVTGSVLIMGEGKGNTEFNIKKDGKATIDGSLFLGSEYTDRKKVKAKLETSKDGELTVNGILTMLGTKVEAKFKKDSKLEVNGMIQIGAPDTKKTKEPSIDLRLEFSGEAEINQDAQEVSEALAALKRLGVKYDLPQFNSLMRSEIISYSWWQAND